VRGAPTENRLPDGARRESERDGDAAVLTVLASLVVVAIPAAAAVAAVAWLVHLLVAH